MNMIISVCTYNNGTFDIILKSKDKPIDITFSGIKTDITDEEFDFLNEAAPACVWTEYKMVKY